MGTSHKVDNSRLGLKLDLRRAMLSKYHGKAIKVLDTCAGTGKLWNVLRAEFDVAEYVATDLRNMPGAMRADASRWIAGLSTLPEVIDIDAWGEPWKLFEQVLMHEGRPDAMTVFVTDGVGRGGGSEVSQIDCRLLGIPTDWARKVPRGKNLRAAIREAGLSLAAIHGQVIECLGWNPGSCSTAYYGMRLVC